MGPFETLDLAQSSRSRAKVGAGAAHTRIQWREIEICEDSTARCAKVGWRQRSTKESPEFEPLRFTGAPQRSYAATGLDPNLCRAAAFVMPIIERHLLLARQMKDVLAGV
jgi:hypothetical protein